MNYRKTLIACYLGFVTQAITANFAPLLFLTFHNVYNIPLGKIALISSVFFITQRIQLYCTHYGNRNMISLQICVKKDHAETERRALLFDDMEPL